MVMAPQARRQRSPNSVGKLYRFGQIPEPRFGVMVYMTEALADVGIINYRTGNPADRPVNSVRLSTAGGSNK